MNAVTLTDLTPPVRDDGNPWTEMLLYEAPNEPAAGAPNAPPITIAPVAPWALIATDVLSPVDTDPTNPATRDITTDAATIQTGGWYQIVWQDGEGATSATPPVQNLSAPRPWRPLVSDVANYLLARTYDPNGNSGTFTAVTKPTYNQVLRTIDQAVAKLEAIFGPTAYNPELIGSAKEVATLRAAMMVEIAFFPEQVNTGRSTYPQLHGMYTEARKDWEAERRTVTATGVPGEGSDTEGPLPVSFFPAPSYIPSDATTGRGPGYEGQNIW